MTDSRESDQEAFLQVLAHRTMLKAFLVAMMRDPSLAEDTLSDTTLEILRAWPSFDRSRPFGPWARGVARRVALANLRKARRTISTLDTTVLESVGGSLDRLGNEVDLDERKARMRHCVEKLSESNRELVRLRYFEDVSYEDLARRTGRARSALYMAFSRIHRALAVCLGGGP